jgi:hypothetical protein
MVLYLFPSDLHPFPHRLEQRKVLNASKDSLVSPITMLKVNNLLRAQLLFKRLPSFGRDIRKAWLVSALRRRRR